MGALDRITFEDMQDHSEAKARERENRPDSFAGVDENLRLIARPLPTDISNLAGSTGPGAVVNQPLPLQLGAQVNQNQPLAGLSAQQAVEPVLEDATDLPAFQRLASDLFGIPQQPLPAVPTSVLPEAPELPAELKQMQTYVANLRNRMDFEFGIDPLLRGSTADKARMLSEFAVRNTKPISEMGRLEKLGLAGSNGLTEIGEIFIGVGMGLGKGAQSAIGGALTAPVSIGQKMAGMQKNMARFPGAGQEVTLPNGEVIEFPYLTSDMSPELKRQLVDLGATFGDPLFQPGILEQIKNDYIKRYGFMPIDQIPPDATSYGIRWSDEMRFVPEELERQMIQRPVSFALDALMGIGTPGAALRLGAAPGLRGAAKIAEKSSGRVTRTSSALARGSVDAAEAGEMLRPGVLIHSGARKALDMHPTTREMLAVHDARVVTNQLINRSGTLSFSQRRAAEIEIGQALSKLTAPELRAIPAVVEGRLSLLPTSSGGLVSSSRRGGAATDLRKAGDILAPSMTPQMEHALQVVRRQIWLRQEERIKAGLLSKAPPPLSPAAAKAEAAKDRANPRRDIHRRERVLDQPTNRAYGPMTVMMTGRLIPDPGMTFKEISRANSIAEKTGMPLTMSHGEYASRLGEARKLYEDVGANMTTLPETSQLPLYFPRFPDPPKNMTQVFKEFFSTSGKRPGKVPSQRHFSGMSLLRNADINDVRQALVRSNAQTRRIVDSAKLIDDLKAQPFVIPARLDKDNNIINQLPDHAIFNPEGYLQYYRTQLNMSERTANALESMGEFESSLAVAVKEAFPEGLNVTLRGARRRENVFQVPKAVADRINRQFQPTHPFMRLVFDPATDAWKSAVLAWSPRWHLNNFIGGLVMGTSAGVLPHKMLKPLNAAEKAALPQELIFQSQAFVERYTPKMGAAGVGRAGRIREAIDNSAPMQLHRKSLGSATDMLFDWNSRVDAHFRNRAYLEIGRSESRNQLMRETGRAIFDEREILQRVHKLGSTEKEFLNLQKRLDSVFVNYSKMTPGERRYLRRVAPFWSWYREISRVAGNMITRSPAKVQALRILGDIGRNTDEMEMRKHLGIGKEDFPEYMNDSLFVGLTNDGSVAFMRPRGGNVFYGVAKYPIDMSLMHPFLQTFIQESTGGRSYGRWGTFVPFQRLHTAEDGTHLDTQSGRRTTSSDPLQSVSRVGRRVARTLPMIQLLENLVQYGTEGVVSSRFEDTSPFSNLGRIASGESITRTAIPLAGEQFEPRNKKPLTQVLLNFAGIPVQQYKLAEMIEQEVKRNQSFSGKAFNKLYGQSAEFQKFVDQWLQENEVGSTTPLESLRTPENPNNLRFDALRTPSSGQNLNER